LNDTIKSAQPAVILIPGIIYESFGLSGKIEIQQNVEKSSWNKNILLGG